MSYLGSLISNPHDGINVPEGGEKKDVTTVKGVYDYFHYKCDGHNDVGWGCGYRTLQTMCSWILRSQNHDNVQNQVPSIPTIQKTLVDIGDKPPEFFGSRDWIGSCEVGYVLNSLYNVDFKILHANGSGDWPSVLKKLSEHLSEGGCPVMMGGKYDAASKCVIGVHGEKHLLLLDPHLTGKASKSRKLITWFSREHFLINQDDFYNFCIPLIRWDEKVTLEGVN